MIDFPETLAARGLTLVLWSPATKRDQRERDIADPDMFIDGKRYQFTPIEVRGVSRSEVEEGFLEAFDKRWPLAKGTVYWRQPGLSEGRRGFAGDVARLWALRIDSLREADDAVGFQPSIQQDQEGQYAEEAENLV